VERFIATYLGAAHRDGAEAGCAIPCLGADVARAGEPARAAFEDGVAPFIARLRERTADAVPIFAMCVGGILLARAVKDRAFSDAILAACRDAARRLARAQKEPA
jgi:TetR/AcrR family transcriptional repressor of nem operon